MVESAVIVRIQIDEGGHVRRIPFPVKGTFASISVSTDMVSARDRMMAGYSVVVLEDSIPAIEKLVLEAIAQPA